MDWARNLRGGDTTTPRPGRPSPAAKTSRLNDDSTDSGGVQPGEGSGVKRVQPRLPIQSRGITGPPQVPPIKTALKTPPTMRTPRLNTYKLHSADSPLDGPDMDSPRAMSVVSVDYQPEEYDQLEGDSVQVYVRVRPPNRAELNATGGFQSADMQQCLQVIGTSSISVSLPGKEPYKFTFDKVLPESSTQDEMHEVAGLPMVDNCISGYNSSIFAYGQTGAGKTHTMLGVIAAANEPPSSQRGLAPRVFEYLFERIAQEENDKGRDNLKYSCRCSFLEIYNETITDLLNTTASSLQIREDPTRGCFVEGLSEHAVLNVDDVLGLMREGSDNRHVGETNMNAKSSRSHSVFTCVVERSSKNVNNGVTSFICSRINLIDLAGSERIMGGALGGSQAQGQHFKEAVHINKSLTTLGRVIMELVEAQRSHRKGHIPYRDSRLTFLLQDSLGGNAKTMIIANVSPSSICGHETVSTLKFVSRAKCIRNKATINLDYRGDVAVLQREIQRLNLELDNLRRGFTDPAIQENKELRAQLKDEESKLEEADLRITNLQSENNRFKRERQRMEEKLATLQANNGSLEGVVGRLQNKVALLETAEEHVTAMMNQVYTLEVQLLQSRADAVQADQQQWQERAEALQEQLQDVQSDLAAQRAESASSIEALQAEIQRLQQEKLEADESSATLAALYSEAKEALGTQREEHAVKEAGLVGKVAELEERLADSRSQLDQERGSASSWEAQAAAARAEVESLKASLVDVQAKTQQDLEDQRTAAEQQAVEAAESAAAALATVQGDLLSAQEQVRQLGADKAAADSQARQLQAELEAALSELSAARDALGSERAAHAGTRAALERSAAALESNLRTDLERAMSEREAELLRVSELEQQLDAAQQSHAARQQELETEVDSHKELLRAERDGRNSVQEELEAERVHSGTLRSSLESAQATAADWEQQATAASAMVLTLKADLAAAQEHLAELMKQQQELQQQLDLQRSSHSDSLSEALKRAAALSAEVSATSQQLQELSAAKEAADALVAEHAREIEVLKVQVVEQEAVHMKENGRLCDQVESLQNDKASLLVTLDSKLAEGQATKEQLMAAEEQLQHKCGELQQKMDELSASQAQLGEAQALCAVLRGELEQQGQSLAAERQATAEACEQVAAKSAELRGLQEAQEAAEVAAAALTREHQAQISTLQKELIKSQESHVSREFELVSQIKSLGQDVDALKRDNGELQVRLQGSHSELTAVRQSLAAQQQALEQARALMGQRETELADERRGREDDRMIAEQRAARDQITISNLKQELHNIQDRRYEIENQMKSALVTTTRQNKAFQEIRRLIEWATTPPSSARSSAAMGRAADGTPLSGVGESLQSPGPSPGPISGATSGLERGMLQVSPRPRHRNLSIAAGADGTSSPVSSPKGRHSYLRRSAAAGSPAARMSLQFLNIGSKELMEDGAAEGFVCSDAKAVGEGLEHVRNTEDDVNSPMGPVSARDQADRLSAQHEGMHC